MNTSNCGMDLCVSIVCAPCLQVLRKLFLPTQTAGFAPPSLSAVLLLWLQVRVAEQEGIVFIDEIDKIVNPSGAIRHGEGQGLHSGGRF